MIPRKGQFYWPLLGHQNRIMEPFRSAEDSSRKSDPRSFSRVKSALNYALFIALRELLSALWIFCIPLKMALMCLLIYPAESVDVDSSIEFCAVMFLITCEPQRTWVAAFLKQFTQLLSVSWSNRLFTRLTLPQCTYVYSCSTCLRIVIAKHKIA